MGGKGRTQGGEVLAEGLPVGSAGAAGFDDHFAGCCIAALIKQKTAAAFKQQNHGPNLAA